MQTLSTQSEKIKAALGMVKSVADAIRDLGSVPSGHLYATIMGAMALDEYEWIIGQLEAEKAAKGAFKPANPLNAVLNTQVLLLALAYFCYITNSVKCGVRSGGRHSDDEVANCRRFLAQELHLLAPLVAVGMGGNAYRTLRQEVLPLLDCPPVVFEITHYSARGDVWSRWEREFAELSRLLTRLRPRAEW